ncbi:MAG: TerC family protein [Endozoicomonadaceae bacterium]|nr:TerC family protein [Endozoicomonadaceae bacterium]MCY4330870.1 TerC family protein [Endozoicomonadaceae bacterium]
MTDPEAWIALVTLTAMEIVLGIDNIIFLTILADRVEKSQRAKARMIGLLFAMLTRILLLFSIAWVMQLQNPLFHIADYMFSGRDLILMFGGMFLLVKSTHEIHDLTNIKPDQKKHNNRKVAEAGFFSVIVQIAIIDIVFSLDSVITAVGMAKNIEVMVIAIMLSVFVMICSVRYIADFIEKNPSIKMLALSFLILIGVMLVAESFKFHIPKGYIYFAMAFSVAVECLNIKRQKKFD